MTRWKQRHNFYSPDSDWTSPLANKSQRHPFPSTEVENLCFILARHTTPTDFKQTRNSFQAFRAIQLVLTVQENYGSTIQNKGMFEMSYPSLRNNQDQVAIWFHYLCNASKCHLSFNKRWQVLHIQVFYKSSVLILIHSIHTLLISDKRLNTQIL